MPKRRTQREVLEEQVEAQKERELKTAQTRRRLEQRLKALDEKDRKKETRLKILMGAFLMDMIQRKVSWLPTNLFHAEFSQWLTRSTDQALYLVWAHKEGLVEESSHTEPSSTNPSLSDPTPKTKRETKPS
jgi:hypothetical protein